MTSRKQTLHTGVLFKRGSGKASPFGRTNWKTRYFVLTSSTLTYYTYEGGKRKGEVALSSKQPTTRNSKNQQQQQQQQHATIEVMPADSKKTGRSASTIWRIAVNAPARRLLLAAGSEWEMNVWVEKLELALRLARNDCEPQQLVHRMSLPAATNTFVTDFQSVNAQRQRQSMAAIGSDSSNEPELWELPLRASTLEAVATPPASSSSSASSMVLSPQEPGAFDQAMRSSSSAYYGDDDSTFECPDSIPIMTPPPVSSSRAVSLLAMHERLSLPSAVEAHVYSRDALSTKQPSVSTIVDFQNFARSRRRLSIDGSNARLRRERSLQQTQLFSTDMYSARAYDKVKETEDEHEGDYSSGNNHIAARELEGSRSSLTRITTESKALQQHRFARLRQWLSFKRSSVEV